MITPRATRLVRVPDLHAYQRVLRRLCRDGDPAAIRRRAVIVPSRASAEQLRRGLEDDLPASGRSAFVLPHLVTRDEWATLLIDDLPDTPAQTTRIEREVLFRAAARVAVGGGAAPPFTLRPGLVAEMLEFYDALRRQMRTIDDFERVAVEALEPSVDSDRGAARMLEQTRFLVAAFRAYEARLVSSCLDDEHTLRRRLLDAADTRFTHVIVAVGDRGGDPAGLWPADFDLLTRAASLGRIDVVSTEAVLASEFLRRLRAWLPGLDEVCETADAALATPILVAPAEAGEQAFWRYRDREEELAGTIRRIKLAYRQNPASPLDRTAVVFKRPLPYVYLARQAFPSAGVPFQSFDALPLAAEPFAAALDLLFECVESDYSRAALVALLRSPHYRFDVDGETIGRAHVAALDRSLSEARYFADPAELGRLAAEWTSAAPRDTGPRHARGPLRSRAAQAAASIPPELEALGRDNAPTSHLDAILAFLIAHERRPSATHPLRERHLRARSAILGALAGLRDAHAGLDDTSQTFTDTASEIRRWIERQTFAPRHGTRGVQLVDANAARFGSFDAVYLVGLIQKDWPESPARSIFYPSSILTHLGWPADADVRAAERAAFDDLLRSARSQVFVSTVTLEEDSIVDPSPFLEDVAMCGLSIQREHAGAIARVFEAEAITTDPLRPEALGETAADWLALRLSRSADAGAQFHGQGDPSRPTRYRVSAIDEYLACPFTYFAAQVLRLEEEPEDEEALSPKAQGRFIHEVLQAFYQIWQDRGCGAVTAENLDAARALFVEIAEDRLRGMPEIDAALQRARLIGTPVAPGVGDIVFQAEAERDRGVPVVDRLLEFSLDGDTVLAAGSATRTVPLAAKADRIDLFADGSFRVIDYKLSHAPKLKHVIQLPAYAAAARQRIEGRLGRSWRPVDAAYLAFGKGGQYEALAPDARQLEAALADGEARLVQAVEGIERGAFPPKPADPHRCTYCPFSAVCRKDCVDDE